MIENKENSTRHLKRCPSCGVDIYKAHDAAQESRRKTACGDLCSYDGGCKCENNGIEYPLDPALARRLKLDRAHIQHGIYWALLNYGPTGYRSIRSRMPGRGYFALDSALQTMRKKGLIKSNRGVWRAVGEK